MGEYPDDPPPLKPQGRKKKESGECVISNERANTFAEHMEEATWRKRRANFEAADRGRTTCGLWAD